MPHAIVSFVPRHPLDEVGECVGAEGWEVSGGMEAGRPVVARYGGDHPRAAVDRLVAALDRSGCDYVALTMPAFDAALDAPTPAWVEVPGRWRLDGDAMRLPRGLTDPGIDLRTLTSAGMALGRAEACLRAAGGA